MSAPIARRSVGGGQKTVTRSRRSHAARSGPSRAVSSSITTTVAPTANASHVSSTDESYACDEPCATRSSAVR